MSITQRGEKSYAMGSLPCCACVLCRTKDSLSSYLKMQQTKNYFFQH